MISGVLTRHWQGGYPLLSSLLVHTALPDYALLLIQRTVAPSLLSADGAMSQLWLAIAAIAWTLLLVWQIVGCFRSASLQVQSSGSAVGLYLVFFVSLVVVATVVGAYFTLAGQFIDRRLSESAVLDDNAGPYVFSVIDSRTLAFNGDIHFGATRDLLAALAEHPEIAQLQLESHGGIIVEARGMANAVLDHQLDTHVLHDCFSACTLVYISGQRRTLNDKARLGFHQYVIDSRFPYPWVKTSVEHEKDRQRFAEQDIEAWFVEKMYSHDHESLWIPSLTELVSARVTRGEIPVEN